MTIKCILFDADGVIINSEMFGVQYQNKYAISKDDIIPFFKEDFPNCIIGKADLMESLENWLPKWKWTGTVAEFLELWFSSENNVDKRMLSMIEELRKNGIKCFLATNQEKYRTDYIRNTMNFDELFDNIFSSSDIGYKKPEIEFYEFILKELEINYAIHSNEIMFFDDSPENIATALEVNIDAHLYKDFKDFRQLITSILN